MNPRLNRMVLTGIAAVCLLQLVDVSADEALSGKAVPCCGKVCKLVFETRKLTAIGFGTETKDICLPDPSRAGCKHCAVCYGKSSPSANGCENCAPKCEFCWRDWFACGCAQPRTVRILTKYQAEKKVCWYHWEVVDGACCDCVSKLGIEGPGAPNSFAQSGHTIYKPAPDDAHVGDVLPITEEEWVRLAAVLSPDPTETTTGAFADSTSGLRDESKGDITPIETPQPAPSLTERLQRLLKK